MRVIVVGAGILGVSICYHLSRQGTEVVLIDKGVPGMEASAASFAWLNSNAKSPLAYSDLNVMSISEWAGLARELNDSSWLHMVGNVHVADSSDDSRILTQRVQDLNSRGYAAVGLEPEELNRVDSVIRIRREYEFAVYFPGEGYIDVSGVIHRLLTASTSLGSTVRSHAQVEALSVEGDAVRGVRLSGGEVIEGDLVVLAAGAAVGDLLQPLGMEISAEGKPGLSVLTEAGTSTLSTVLHFSRLSVRPAGGGRLIVRSYQADDQISVEGLTVSEDVVHMLLDETAHRLTDVRRELLGVDRVRVAVPPYPSDGLPVVGPVEAFSGLYIASMHSGVTLGAIMGRLVSGEICQSGCDELLEAYRPARMLSDSNRVWSAVDRSVVEGERLTAP